FVLCVDAADLEELPFLPLALTGGKKRTVRPDHRGGRALGVTETTGKKRLAFAGRAVLLLDKLHKAIGILVGGQLVQSGKSRLGAGHARALLDNGGSGTSRTVLDRCKPSPSVSPRPSTPGSRRRQPQLSQRRPRRGGVVCRKERVRQDKTPAQQVS